MVDVQLLGTGARHFLAEVAGHSRVWQIAVGNLVLFMVLGKVLGQLVPQLFNFVVGCRQHVAELYDAHLQVCVVL